MPHSTALYIRLPNWIGDVCMVLPVIHALCAVNRNVYLCARPWAQDLLAGIDSAGFVPMTGRAIEDRRTVARHRKKTRWPARGLLLPDSLSSAAVFCFGGVPSAGYRDDGRTLLLKWPFSKSTEPLHAVQSWYRLAVLAQHAWNDPALPDTPPAKLALPLTPEHVATATAALAKQGLSDQPFILIAPTATGLHKGRVKVWPEFAALSRALIAEGHRVAYCVPPDEQEQARLNAPDAQAIQPMGLGAFAAMTRRAQVVICNDSGVSHIAAAANARQITLFGVTSALRTGPWSPDAICLGDMDNWPSLDDVLCRTRDALVSNS